jgi:hypothetical protein
MPPFSSLLYAFIDCLPRMLIIIDIFADFHFFQRYAAIDAAISLMPRHATHYFFFHAASAATASLPPRCRPPAITPLRHFRHSPYATPPRQRGASAAERAQIFLRHC